VSAKRSFEIVAENEGGWADDKRDRGGRTRWGVSSKAHPGVDLDSLHTFEDALRVVYVPKYWAPICGEELGEPLDFTVLDAAVHHGTWRAKCWLQSTLGVKVDGKIGDITLARVERLKPDTRATAQSFNERRIKFMVDGFRNGSFVDGDLDLRGETIYLWNFWRRTARISYEIGRTT